MIYFDNAATSWPKPEAVYQAMDQFGRRYAGNPGRGVHALATAAGEMVLMTRQRIAQLLGADHVVFTSNATDALNLCLKGLLRAGDHVVTSMLEHNSVTRPLQTVGAALTRVTSGRDAVIDPDDVRRALQATTKLVALTYCANVTGTVQPIAEIARITRERGVLLLVDAAQAAGLVPIDMRTLGIDLLAAPGHKSLLGPTGTGFLAMRDGIEIVSSREGGIGLHPLEAGTLNIVGLAGLDAGVTYVSAHPSLEHERMLAARFIAGLPAGITVHGRPDVGIVSITLPEMSPTEASVVLDQHFHIATRAGLHCAPAAHDVLGTAPEGTLRFSFGPFNTVEQIDRAIAAVAELKHAS